MKSIEFLIACALAVWFTAAAIGQVRVQAIQRWRRLDIFGLIPMWWFFAPTPLTSDLVIVTRDRDNSGAVSAWTELRVGGDRNWLSFVWNPGRRDRKAAFDLTIALLAASGGDPRPNPVIQISIPYLGLVNYAVHLPLTNALEARQFAIIKEDADDAQAIFLSAWHRV